MKQRLVVLSVVMLVLAVGTLLYAYTKKTIRTNTIIVCKKELPLGVIISGGKRFKAVDSTVYDILRVRAAFDITYTDYYWSSRTDVITDALPSNKTLPCP